MTIIKHADDKQPHFDALEALLARPDLDKRTKKLIDDEIWAVRLGRKGEAEAAYDIDFAYKDKDSYVVIHDLRLEVGGRVAQIDHLILNRVLDVWVCETKAFSQGVKIDDLGYWRRYAGSGTYGMASPVLQNENHVRVLRDVFDSGAIKLPRRVVTLKPTYFPVVLLSNSAKLDLPKSRAARQAIRGLNTVMKSEELWKRIYDSFDDDIRAVRALPKLVSTNTILDIGHQLVALHRPAVPDYAAMFGIRPLDARPVAPFDQSQTNALAAGDTCEVCGRNLTEKVLAYLEEHAAEFDGSRLCYDCQRFHRRSRRSGSKTTSATTPAGREA